MPRYRDHNDEMKGGVGVYSGTLISGGNTGGDTVDTGGYGDTGDGDTGDMGGG